MVQEPVKKDAILKVDASKLTKWKIDGTLEYLLAI